MDQLHKQPAESFPIAVDFSANLLAAETIIAQTVTATDSSGADATAAVISAGTVGNDGQGLVIVTVTGGEATKQPYKLTFRAQTSAGNTWEMDIKMMVQEL